MAAGGLIDMDSLWAEVAKQIPSLAVLCFLVIAFIKHLTAEGDRGERMESSRNKALKEISDSCHESQREIVKETTMALARAATVIDRNAEVLGKTIHVIERLQEKNEVN